VYEGWLELLEDGMERSVCSCDSSSCSILDCVLQSAGKPVHVFNLRLMERLLDAHDWFYGCARPSARGSVRRELRLAR